MSRFKLLGFAAISWLPLVSLVGNARASELFDAASDWKATYANTAAVIAASAATWGNATAAGVWTAGNLSFNFTNQQVLGQADGTPANGNYFLNYYQPTTGYETSNVHQRGHVQLHGPVPGESVHAGRDDASASRPDLGQSDQLWQGCRRWQYGFDAADQYDGWHRCLCSDHAPTVR